MEAGRIGRRIAYWRERRGLTQTDFGRLMGQAKRWVQDIEGGKRQNDPRLSVLLRAAEVLRVPLEYLLSDNRPAPTPDMTTPPEVLRVLDALHLAGTGSDVPVPPMAGLRRRLVYCCEAFQACHYTSLGRELPGLIRGAEQLVYDSPANRGAAARALLSRVYQLTTSYLHKYGPPTATPAALAADRALNSAELSGDPVQVGAAARRVAKSLVYQNRPETAADFASGYARRLASELPGRGAVGLSTLGMLYLSAALAVSSRERTIDHVRTASGFIDEAAEVARRQGADLNEDWTMFGRTNVTLHRVDMLVRFEDGWSALEAAKALTPESISTLKPERRARFHLSKAHAGLLTRQKEQAADELLLAHALAPEEVERRPRNTALVKDTLRVTAIPDSRLRALAGRCGLRA
ncbi:helix-turn-helix transcriptional regulator [Streptomyces sp. NPDC020875]|uniref:helix-turn-helix domain-containing protein n=1 Tax=Streptomyces sp. NPDC020875 TaxID=3154898 RepID=UPI0033DCB80A